MNKLITFSDRLRHRMAELKYSKPDVYQHHLASKANITKQNVQQWLDGGGASSKKATILAKILKTTVQWLVDGEGKPSLTSIKTDVKELEIIDETLIINKYPLLEWGDINEQGVIVNMQLMERSDKQYETNHSGENCFGLVVNSESMAPEFKKGEQILVDRDKEPINESYVVIQLKKEGLPVLRQLINDGGDRFLRVLNPDWPNKFEALTSEHVIIGCVVEAKRRY